MSTKKQEQVFTVLAQGVGALTVADQPLAITKFSSLLSNKE